MPVRKQDDDDFQNKLHLSKIDFHTPPLCGKALHNGADALASIRIVVKGFSILWLHFYSPLKRGTPYFSAMTTCSQTYMMKTTRAVALTRSQPAPTTRIPLILHALACKMAPSSCLRTQQTAGGLRQGLMSGSAANCCAICSRRSLGFSSQFIHSFVFFSTWYHK